jgi:hypothetical protein
MVHRGQSASKKVLAENICAFSVLRGAKYIRTVFLGRATHWWGLSELASSVRDEEPHTRPVRTGNTDR